LNESNFSYFTQVNEKRPANNNESIYDEINLVIYVFIFMNHCNYKGIDDVLLSLCRQTSDLSMV
jgi:hypothetical protein